jgi:hypothetical protein
LPLTPRSLRDPPSRPARRRNCHPHRRLAQVFGAYPTDKFGKARIKNIAQVLATEGNEADVAELVRRVVFNAIIGNGDMHIKSWSLIYRERRTAALAPAFVSTVAYIPQDQTFALRFSRAVRTRPQRARSSGGLGPAARAAGTEYGN